MEGLRLRADRHLALHRQVRQEFLNLAPAHFQRMTLVVKQDVAPHPRDIAFFRSQAVVPPPQHPPRPVQQSRWRRLRFPGHAATRAQSPARPTPAPKPRGIEMPRPAEPALATPRCNPTAPAASETLQSR